MRFAKAALVVGLSGAAACSASAGPELGPETAPGFAEDAGKTFVEEPVYDRLERVYDIDILGTPQEVAILERQSQQPDEQNNSGEDFLNNNGITVISESEMDSAVVSGVASSIGIMPCDFVRFTGLRNVVIVDDWEDQGHSEGTIFVDDQYGVKYQMFGLALDQLSRESIEGEFTQITQSAGGSYGGNEDPNNIFINFSAMESAEAEALAAVESGYMGFRGWIYDSENPAETKQMHVDRLMQEHIQNYDAFVTLNGLGLVYGMRPSHPHDMADRFLEFLPMLNGAETEAEEDDLRFRDFELGEFAIDRSGLGVIEPLDKPDLGCEDTEEPVAVIPDPPIH